jgi:hypothetical protein
MTKSSQLSRVGSGLDHRYDIFTLIGKHEEKMKIAVEQDRLRKIKMRSRENT